MGDEKTITVADLSDGACSRGKPDTPVSLPVVELLTGRGFVTGKSGSGKSNSASVIAEKLLDNGFGLLIVDIDGEYYGLKEEYEILHAGGDEECDIQVTPDHAEKLATLALEQNVPIILDVSSFLDESEARELLTAVAKQLFVKEKKLKQPFLLLVEEIHEYVPENGGLDECGRMLIKIGKRGRKHGLGITGISQRPADVKKDFITQCDWLLWHRLTWNNDTKVVQRIIDAAHADAVEDLGDGEGFLMTDWAENVRRVQFRRKQTFDAGATPGLDDFERPELKSVSDDLVSELQTISEAEQEREDTIAELRAELDRKNTRIAELERELQDARDLSRMADQFVDALLDEVEGAAPGRTEADADAVSGAVPDSDGSETDGERDVPEFDAEAVAAAFDDAEADSDDFGENSDDFGENSDDFGEDPDDGRGAGDGEAGSEDAGGPEGTEEFDVPTFESFEEPGDAPTVGDDHVTEPDDQRSAMPFTESDVPEFGFSTPGDADDDPATGGSDDESIAAAIQEIEDREVTGSTRPEPPSVGDLRATIRDLDPRARRMLAYYHEHGPVTPLDAHFVAGGTGDRTDAYAHNSGLREAELIEHVGRGKYDTCLDDRLRDATGGKLDADERRTFLARLESLLEVGQ